MAIFNAVFTNPDGVASLPALLTSSGGNIAVDALLGPRYEVELTEATTQLDNPTGLADGQEFTILIKQDATGSRALTFDSAWLRKDGLTTTIAAAASTVSILRGHAASLPNGPGLRIYYTLDHEEEAAGGGTDADAIHDNVAGEISAITLKGTPVSGDLLVIEDSADSNNKKRITIGTLPSGGGGGGAATEEGVSNAGLLFYIDAGRQDSYPGSGTTVTDTVDSRALTISGGIVTGGAAKSHFNFPGGGSDAITGTVDANLTALWGGGATVAYWCRPETAGDTNNGAIIHTGTALGSNGWGIKQAADAAEFRPFIIKQSGPSTSSSWEVTDGSGFAFNEWYFVVIRYDADSAANDATIYVNDVSQPVTETFAGVAGTSDDLGNTLRIGGFTGENYEFNGDIDAIYIWDRELDDEEISYQYNVQKPRFELFGALTDVNAVHVNTGSEISTITEKTVPVGADLILIEDSAAANAKKRIQIGNLPLPPGVADTGLPADSFVFYMDVARHDFYSGTGTAALELSNGIVMTLGGGVLTGGAANSHFNFDGVDDDITGIVPAAMSALWTSGGTVAYWCRPESAGQTNNGAIVHTGTGLGSNGWGIKQAADSAEFRPYFIKQVGFTTSSGWEVTNSNGLPFGEWYFVVVRYDATLAANDATIYINNVSFPITENFAGAIGSTDDTGNTIRIGDFNGEAYAFDGDIDAIYMWKRELSDEEITLIYNLQRPRFYPAVTRLDPAAITTTESNYNPTGWGPNITHLHLSVSTAQTLNGIERENWTDETSFLLFNDGTSTLTLSHNSNGSDGFLIEGSVNDGIDANGVRRIVRDESANRWRVLGTP